MTYATRFTAAKTSDSSDRTPAIGAAKPTAPAPRKAAGRVGSAARRFLDALVRSLAAPHS